jgi:hypothetical protein
MISIRIAGWGGLTKLLTKLHPLRTTASRPALRPTQPPIQWVPAVLSMEIKRPGREADHSPPSSAEVKEWVELYLHSPNTPSWRGAQLKHRDNFTLPFTFTFYVLTDVRSVVDINVRPFTIEFFCINSDRKETLICVLSHVSEPPPFSMPVAMSVNYDLCRTMKNAVSAYLDTGLGEAFLKTGSQCQLWMPLHCLYS